MIDPANLISALNHPVRRRILRSLKPDYLVSPIELTHELDEGLSYVSYHVNVLVRLEVLQLSHTEPVRGTAEHFYSLNSFDANARWVRAALKATKDKDEEG
jgi:DNA-binding transcriptional ArsR family regulator